MRVKSVFYVFSVIYFFSSMSRFVVALYQKGKSADAEGQWGDGRLGRVIVPLKGSRRNVRHFN